LATYATKKKKKKKKKIKEKLTKKNRLTVQTKDKDNLLHLAEFA
jgi:hypothetical protein